MKSQGKIRGVPVLLLVDSDATHNFVFAQLAETMGWPITETKPLRIKLEDGYRAMSRGRNTGVKLELDASTIELDALLFDLEGIDVILWMAWLASLGGMWVD